MELKNFRKVESPFWTTRSIIKRTPSGTQAARCIGGPDPSRQPFLFK